ncbi:hypothetical protein IL252_12240 [Halomicrobium sp. IBSBa]|uniref:hypothetical protein n=1 Tax=Halomicrobium sp. IBSBa TaxID=2778916 RepID=UPI001ABF5808|nr:hypothetical protein [Halomicrobium sp. IBSBa]MBO4248584.1 hypothetical protein [Halomicrobium sp. IBSBa]
MTCRHSDTTGRTLERRRLLAGLGGLTALSGCLSAGTDGGCTDSGVSQGGLRLLNADGRPHTVELTVFLDVLVVREVVFDERVTVPGRNADEDRHVLLEDVVDRSGRHVLRARVRATGETTDYLWEVAAEGCTGLLVSVDDGVATVTAVDTDGGRQP